MLFRFAQRRKWYFMFSGTVILVGIIAMIYSTITIGTPVRVSIDFTGGSLVEVSFVKNVSEDQVREALDNAGVEDYVVQRLDPLSSDEVDFKTSEAGSRWEIRVAAPEGTDLRDYVASLKTYLEAPEQLGPIWSYRPEDSDEEKGAWAYSQLPISDIYPNGAALVDASFAANVSQEQIEAALTGFGATDFEVAPISTVAGSRWQIRMEETDVEDLKVSLQEQLGAFWTPDPNEPQSAITSSSVSATVGKEVTQSAVSATLAVAAIILFFIVWAFRKVPHAFRYGACAIAAMFHDILVTMGVMSILGILFKWEADALFMTAVLTVVGYSVQDTIVVFDRIRENISKYRGEEYDLIVNRSILETIHRSLATQLNAVFIMIAILLFGGETIRHFIAIMMIGLASGTYSSIFNAVPLLISWEKGEIPFVNQEAKRKRKNEEMEASAAS
jgi:preprotein translocase SecF subunit